METGNDGWAEARALREKLKELEQRHATMAEVLRKNAETITAAHQVIRQCQSAVKTLGELLQYVAAAWQKEASQGDGIAEEHVPIYEAARAASMAGIDAVTLATKVPALDPLDFIRGKTREEAETARAVTEARAHIPAHHPNAIEEE